MTSTVIQHQAVSFVKRSRFGADGGDSSPLVALPIAAKVKNTLKRTEIKEHLFIGAR